MLFPWKKSRQGKNVFFYKTFFPLVFLDNTAASSPFTKLDVRLHYSEIKSGTFKDSSHVGSWCLSSLRFYTSDFFFSQGQHWHLRWSLRWCHVPLCPLLHALFPVSCWMNPQWIMFHTKTVFLTVHRDTDWDIYQPKVVYQGRINFTSLRNILFYFILFIYILKRSLKVEKSKSRHSPDYHSVLVFILFILIFFFLHLCYSNEFADYSYFMLIFEFN